MSEVIKKQTGSLVISESEPGSGKTEVAVSHFKMLYEKGLVDACYFALPTRTSAAQIHKRLKIAVGRIFKDENMPVTLAVPGYMTDVNDGDSFTFEMNDRPGEQDDNWHSETSKKYLSSTFAVGTIDQALLSVLNVRHSTLRWSSMGRSLIIVDEVHATDSYMATLLESLISQHIARGGHVLLMSATLGSVAANPFIRAAGFVNIDNLPLSTARRFPYPVVRHVVGGKYYENAIPSDSREKKVSIQTKRIMDKPGDVAKIAASHVRNGAKVIVFRNTVKSCIDVQLELEKILPADMMLEVIPGVNTPHHGRFAAEDRVLIDSAVENAFGKVSPQKGIVAVGTQTIEQSLDIDADIIITDLAPMDVLLQRLGRLHRHIKSNERVKGYENAEAIVLTPDHEVKDYAVRPGNGIGIQRAYENVAHSILTLKEIEGRKNFVIPRDCRELVEICSHEESFENLDLEDKTLKTHIEKNIGNGLAGKTSARSNLRSESWRYGDTVLSQSKTSNITRLGEIGVRVDFDEGCKSFSGKSINGITIPRFLIKELTSLNKELKRPVDFNIISDKKKENKISFKVGDNEFHYSRHGLNRVS